MSPARPAQEREGGMVAGYEGWKGLQRLSGPTSDFMNKENEVQGVECKSPHGLRETHNEEGRAGHTQDARHVLALFPSSDHLLPRMTAFCVHTSNCAFWTPWQWSLYFIYFYIPTGPRWGWGWLCKYWSCWIKLLQKWSFFLIQISLAFTHVSLPPSSRPRNYGRTLQEGVLRVIVSRAFYALDLKWTGLSQDVCQAKLETGQRHKVGDSGIRFRFRVLTSEVPSHLQAFRLYDIKELYLKMHIRFQLVESLKSQSPLKTYPHSLWPL